MSPETLNLDQVAQLLGLHPKTVKRYLQIGRIPAPMKFGRISRWSYATLLTWIAAKKLSGSRRVMCSSAKTKAPPVVSKQRALR